MKKQMKRTQAGHNKKNHHKKRLKTPKQNKMYNVPLYKNTIGGRFGVMY